MFLYIDLESDDDIEVRLIILFRSFLMMIFFEF